MTGMVVDVDLWRYEAGLGVCSDPRREFGRDYRIIALLDDLADREARLAAVEVLADEWDANLRREFVLSDDDPKWTDKHSRELRAVLHRDPSEPAQGGGER